MTFVRFSPMKLSSVPTTDDQFGGPQIFRHVDIQGHEAAILNSIPEESFQQCFEQWKILVTRCIAVQGAWFKGDRNH